MKNNSNLYFDIWRKRNFKSLVQAYIYTASTYHTKTEMRLGFGYALDKYVAGGRGSYEGTTKQWYSAYILGRELGIFYRENDFGGYFLSNLAEEVLEDKITAEEYLTNYFLNFNQLINGQVVHPLREILMCIADNNGKITVNEIKRIRKFNFHANTEKNQNQLINILLHRLIDAEILEESNKEYYLKKYKFSDLFENLYIYSGTATEFEKMSHEEFVELLSNKSQLLINNTFTNRSNLSIDDRIFLI